MKKIIFAASLVLGASLLSGPAMAIPASGPASMPLPSDTQQIQFFFGGRNYCWYDDGWHGPGFYWCGYAFRRGLGWGGGVGWHGWHHRGGGHIGGHGGRHPSSMHRGSPGRVGAGAVTRGSRSGSVNRGAVGRGGGARGGGGHSGGGHGGGSHGHH